MEDNLERENNVIIGFVIIVIALFLTPANITTIIAIIFITKPNIATHM